MDPGPDGLRRALAVVAPDLAVLPLRINHRYSQPNPLYWSTSAWIDDRFVAKYAWSDARAERLRREATLLQRLRTGPTPLAVPEVVVASDDPSLLVTVAVAGRPLSWEWASELTRTAGLAAVADELGTFLDRLHRLPVADILGGLPVVVPTAQADTAALRQRFVGLVDDRRAVWVRTRCDWVDDVLAPAAAPEPIVVHGDLHGYNQVWDGSTLELRAVVDFEESGAGDPHFDFRYLPGNSSTVDLVLAVVASYEGASGVRLSLDRIMAWHTLSCLGDALWRTEAGVPLPGGGDPCSWVDDLAQRFAALHR
jgi:aminoglycoside phosphotransferase (APT) family kinase protein